MVNNELYHHGIKGQKWGIRHDYTPTGKKKYRDRIVNTNKGPLQIRKTKSLFDDKSTSDNEIYLGNKKIGNLTLYEINNSTLNIGWIGLDLKYRGNGYAQSVLRDVLDYATISGYDNVTLEVPGISPDAAHIYQKNGFHFTQELLNTDNSVWGGLRSMQYDIPRRT